MCVCVCLFVHVHVSTMRWDTMEDDGGDGGVDGNDEQAKRILRHTAPMATIAVYENGATDQTH